MPTNAIIKGLENGLIPLCNLSLPYVIKYLSVQIDATAKVRNNHKKLFFFNFLFIFLKMNSTFSSKYP